MTALLDLTGIVKRFGEGEAEITVLPGCDLTVEDGEFVAVVGQSGSGKSTLMNIIGLLDRPTAGTYLLAGDDVSQHTDDELAHLRAEQLGFVFQNFNLIGRISAQANVEMPMIYAGVSRRERSRRAAELLDLVGMSDRAQHLPSQLSGGQKQRVAIARALANDPSVILADEPTGALDTGTGRMVMDLFHELNRDHGKTIIFITHNPELAAECSRTVTMVDGRLS
ncbi:ABC transporter ATP-binding protein [uncultured Corynebacterium sp.]|uniref:ABC transporter ATP-binding protein n=1 Tax=uncultured Corynebacterium sp. TaxID=159447 RepID=UPI0025CE0097|nr:ABC transporter ATP-binding protein [uncultured Corynebacterium sp.]